MNIFISGHKGYLGNLIKKDLKKNNHKIIIFKKKIYKDFDLKKKNLDCVIHSANKFHSKNKRNVYDVNYLLSKNIYRQINSTKSEKKILFINLNTIRIKEKNSYKTNYYVDSKKKFTNFVKKSKKRILFIDLLIPSVFGKKGNNKDFYSTTMIKLKKNKNVILKNPNFVKRYIKIDNFLFQFMKIFQKFTKKKNPGYLQIEIKPDFKKTILEFTKLLKRQVKSKSRIKY